MVGRLSAQETGSYYVMYIRTPAFAVQRVDGAGCQPTIPEGQINPMNQIYILTNGSQGLWSNRGRVMGGRKGSVQPQSCSANANTAWPGGRNES